MARGLGGLSLAIASEVVAQLENMGVHDLWIKWPNDIVYKDAKLGGILVEIVGEANGTCLVVCGIGLNVSMNGSGLSIDQAWTDLRGVTNAKISRNCLAGRLCGTILRTMVEYPSRGFGGYKRTWSERDVLRDREVAIHSGDAMCMGIARGVGEDGALIVEVAGELRQFYGGDVTVRPVENVN
jgi:BirA family biotin operon repressor/biotin-[acetyl-CoA-carboxylase] ligase